MTDVRKELMKSSKYVYPFWVTLLATIPPGVFLVTGIVLLPQWARTVWVVLYQCAQGIWPSPGDLRLILGAWIPLVIGLVFLAMHTAEIEVHEQGIQVRIFIFKQVFIPWQDILDIRAPNLPGYSDPSLWTFIQVRKLTIFHRLVGIAYLMGPRPVLMINRYLRGYDEIVSLLRERIAS